MGGIPLPALGVRPPEQPDLLGNVGKVVQLQSMLQAQKQQAAMAPGQLQLQQQQIQQGQLEQKIKEQQLKDQQTTMQILSQHGGNLSEALPDLAHSVSAPTFMALRKQDIETRKDLAEIDDKELKVQQDKYSRLSAIVGQAQQMNPQDYAQAWPQIAAQAKAIDPKIPVDPSTPIPQDKLGAVGMGFQTHQEYIAQETQKREQRALDLKESEGLRNPTEASLALKATSGGPEAAQAEAALKRLDESKRAARPVNNLMTGNDAKDIADAIENGDQPPTLQGLYRNAAPVRAELARRGVPIAKMEMDWNATKKYMGTLNGAQQVRLRQAIETAGDSLDKIQGLYDEWQKLAPVSGFKVANHAALVAMKNLPGRGGAVANALDAQIADLTAELGNVYMGGNSPTDHSLSLAQQNLKSEWGPEAFQEAMKQARLNIGIRKNSITHGGPAGVSGDNTYMPTQGGAPAAPSGGFDWNTMPQHK